MSISTAIDRIIDITARTEGGGRYDAWNPDDNGHGVSYGLIQFNQQSGTLPELLKSMHSADAGLFYDVFSRTGTDPSDFLDADWVRNAELNSPQYFNALIEAAQYPVFQRAQRDLARIIYFAQTDALAKKYGLFSERAYAMIFDAFVQRSPSTVKNAMADAVRAGGSELEILSMFAFNVDETTSGTRRRDLFASRSLSDKPFGSTSLASVMGSLAASNPVRLAGLSAVVYYFLLRKR
jgi:hypothetical protein